MTLQNLGLRTGSIGSSGNTAAKILLIDDSEDNITLLRELLEREGYTIDTAPDGLSGLEKARTFAPDMILSDVMMPGLNGFQLTQRLRADSTISFIPIILITARNDNNDKVRALEAGADDFLIKPIQRLELIARVRSLIKLKHSNDALVRVAAERGQLYKEAERRALELSTLNETSLGIGSQISLPELLNQVITKSCGMVNARSGIIYLTQPDNRLEIVVSYNTAYDYVGKSIALGEGVAGLIALTQKPMRLNNYFEWSGRAALFENDETMTAVVGLPLISNGRIIGVMEIYDDWQNHIFTDDDVRLLNLLTPQAAVSISNAQLYEQVSRERDRLTALLNSVNDGIVMMDTSHKVVLANQQFSELLDLPAERVQDEQIQDVVQWLGETVESDPPFSRELMESLLRVLARNPQRGFVRKFILHTPKERGLEWTASPVLDSQRQVVGWLNVFHDFTQQRELEQLRQDFVDMLVHDLKGPLGGVMGGLDLITDLIMEGNPDDITQAQDFLQLAQRNCVNMLDMVTSLLEVSKIEAGQMPMNLQETTLQELITSSINQVQHSGHEKQVAFIAQLPEDDVPIRIDLTQMRRLLVNLLSNALKFSPEGMDVRVVGQVESGLRRRGTTSTLGGRTGQTTAQLFLDQQKDADQLKAMLITVSDDGPGIPTDSLSRIFNKFTQLDNGKKKGGSGLGLAYCKLVAEAHGGRVWAESELGRGSTFYISIPCVIDKDKK